MSSEETKQIIQLLLNKGIQFDVGLTDNEVLGIELKFNIKLPPDLKSFLQMALPISDGFDNWRQGLHSEEEANQILYGLDWPLDGMLFDLRNDAFWIKEWGKKPDTYEEQEAFVKEKYKTFPKLVPIYSHRFIPSAPLESGNPVFSVYQTDIIYYGYDLATYFSKEFNFELPDNFQIPGKPKNIRFWTWWVEEGWMED